METIQLVLPQQEYVDFMAMPDGLAKNVNYYNNMYGRGFTEASITKKDGCIYYAANTFKIVKSTKSSYYIKRINKDGFTINEKGKVSFWFNKNIFQIPHINAVFKYFNFNWLDFKLYPFITKGIFEKMLALKITNNVEVCKAYIKAMRINCSPALFLKLFQTNSISKQDFLRKASVAKDINHFIEYLLTPNDTRSLLVYEDMVKEAQILERKIDYNWSSKRLIEEHKAWTEEIMQIEVDSLKDVTLAHLEPFEKYTPDGFTLLKSQKEVFAEGKLMRHCIYTAYWSPILNSSYIAYHVKLNDEEVTLGLNLNRHGLPEDKVTFNQCYGKYNSTPSSAMLSKVKQFIKKLNQHVKKDNIFSLKFYVDPSESVETLTF
jgi:hypothetical protein